MPAGDDLTVFLFFLALAAGFGVAAATVSDAAAIRRWVFILLTVVCVFLGLFWLQIKMYLPAFADAAGSVANNPSNWFVIIMFGLLVFALQPSERRSTIAVPLIQPQAPERELKQNPELERESRPAVTQLALASSVKPREFVDVTPSYLSSLRNQENLTRVQTDRMLAPYLGKWMRISGEVHDIFPNSVLLKVQPAELLVRYNVTATPAETEREKFHLLQRGKCITVVGYLGRVNYSEIELEECELES